MAQAAVSVVIENLGDLLIQQTIQKVIFLKDVPGQVERLKTLLIDMQSFLKYADEKQDDDPRIRNWVSKIRVAAYDTEDVIEAFIVKIQAIKNKGFLKRFIYFPKRLLCLYKVGKDIQSIQLRISDIDKSRQIFGIENLGKGGSTRAEELRQLRQSFPFTEEEEFVGLEDKIDSLVAQLLRKDRRRRVISIVGMPGVGKTILARKVYHHALASSQFACCAWIYISQKYDFTQILREIIKQVHKITSELLEMLERMQQADLERMVHADLLDKRYLLVVDDVWDEDAWDYLTRVLPDVSNGSRLLLTSRYENMARHADALSVPYELKTLKPDDSWELFLKKTFGNSVNPICPPNLEPIGRKIVDRCDGLPLAITVIGSLLQGMRDSESEWQRVLDTLSTHLSSGRQGVCSILELSYNDLPADLKPCLLHFSFFPGDYEIPTRKLFHMWIAQGLISQKGGEVLEDIAVNHLNVLIIRNLVQVVAVRADETVKSCRVHDLLRELLIKKAREEILLEIHDLGESQPSAKCRNLAIHCSSETHTYTGYSTPHLRSMLFFKLDRVEPGFSLDLTSFKLLRVLDLENSGSTNFPDEVCALILLRYLGLRNMMITKLPTSLRYLKSLQTLDISTRKVVVEVPNIIWKLENLRHLYMDCVQHDEALKFENLRALQTLTNVNAQDLMHNNLTTLTSLRKLGVEVDDISNMDEIFSRIAKLGNLRSLCLIISKGSPSLIGLSNLSHLTDLKLLRPLSMLPGPYHFPPHLSRLSLVNTMLKEDPMPILEKLEHLSALKLKMAYSGVVLKTSENGFLQLKFLELSQLHNLSLFDIGEGSMPNVRCLRIFSCAYLNIPSTRFKSMTALQKLEIQGVSLEFIASLGVLNPDDISHVSTVILKRKPDSEEMQVEPMAGKSTFSFVDAGRYR